VNWNFKSIIYIYTHTHSLISILRSACEEKKNLSSYSFVSCGILQLNDVKKENVQSEGRREKENRSNPTEERTHIHVYIYI